MEKRGMNCRIQSLRERSVTTQAHIDMERAKYFTETYRQYEGTVSVPELRALALKNYFSKKINMTRVYGCLMDWLSVNYNKSIPTFKAFLANPKKREREKGEQWEG